MFDVELCSLSQVKFDPLYLGQIHVWHLCTSDFTQESTSTWNFERYLSSSELEVRDKFLFDRDKHRYVLTRFLLKSCLSYYHPMIHVTDWKFSHNQYGRPSVSFPAIRSDFSFNISHSGNYIVCAFATGGTLGVDIERQCSKQQFLDISKRFFSPSESKFIAAHRGVAGRDFFYRLWTLKEAFVKAEGVGLSLDFSKFCFSLDGDSIGFSTDVLLEIPQGAYFFGQGRFPPHTQATGYEFAIAFRTRNSSIDFPQVQVVGVRSDLSCKIESVKFDFSGRSQVGDTLTYCV